MIDSSFFYRNGIKTWRSPSLCGTAEADFSSMSSLFGLSRRSARESWKGIASNTQISLAGRLCVGQNPRLAGRESPASVSIMRGTGFEVGFYSLTHPFSFTPVNFALRECLRQ